MFRLILLELFLLPVFTGSRPTPPSYQDEVRQFMFSYRETHPIRDTPIVEYNAELNAGFVKEAFKDSADIGEKDREEISTWLAHPLIKQWTPDLVGGPAYLITVDSVKQLVKEAEDRRQVDKMPDFFLKKPLYSFSAPIFFHEHTLCLFYTSWYQGSISGSWTVYLFRKEGQDWKQVKTLYRAVS